MITGSFSLVSQSMAMGCFPRLHIQHTSDRLGGQIFIPGEADQQAASVYTSLLALLQDAVLACCTTE